MMLEARDPNDRADQLLAVATRLRELIQQEVEAMRARRLDGGGANWDEKERLVHTWRLEVQRIKHDPSLISGADAGRKAALRDASQGLERELVSHEAALKAMREVTEGLVKTIATEVGAARSGPRGYGADGGLQGAARTTMAGVTVNAKA
ncbi:MAG: hypothetical protein R3C52_13740 [Hyphomonadaceae bacterium]